MSNSPTNCIDKPVPTKVLLREHRQLRRRMAACIVAAMANTDRDFADIAKRCGRNAKTVRRDLYALIDGKEIKQELDYLSDVLLAMGCEPQFHIMPLSEYAKATA